MRNSGLVTSAPSQPLMPLTALVPLICVTLSAFVCVFFWAGFFLRGTQPRVSEPPEKMACKLLGSELQT